MVYTAHTTDSTKQTRSLSSAIRIISDSGGGRVRFPNDQNVIVKLRGNRVNVEYSSHPWLDEDNVGEEHEGLNKVAKVVKSLSPGSRIKVLDEEAVLEEYGDIDG